MFSKSFDEMLKVDISKVMFSNYDTRELEGEV